MTIEKYNGHKLDTTDLAAQFEPYYQSGQRIIVQKSYGDVTVTVTV